MTDNSSMDISEIVSELASAGMTTRNLPEQMTRRIHQIFVRSLDKGGWEKWYLEQSFKGGHPRLKWPLILQKIDSHTYHSLANEIDRMAYMSGETESTYMFWSQGTDQVSSLHRRLDLATRITDIKLHDRLVQFSRSYFVVFATTHGLLTFDRKYSHVSPMELVEMLRSNVPDEWIIAHMNSGLIGPGKL